MLSLNENKNYELLKRAETPQWEDLGWAWGKRSSNELQNKRQTYDIEVKT